MDKYEYKLKLDQMKSLAAEGKYEEAAEVVDSINWRKIKNINALVKAGEIYEKVGRYDDSREVLLTAYDKSPIGRMIIYRLAEVALKTQSFDEAKEYYQEFVEIAPHDNLKYVLKYEICKAQGADIQTLIQILEELKNQEYLEEWAYELACLYHRAGMSEKCIAACDELILWFGDGPYVERALELKMLYQPLTKQQEEKYRNFRQQKDGFVEVRPDDELESGEIIPEPVQIKNVKMSPERFNTQNLQEELQRSMQEIMNATEKEAVDDTMDNIKKLVEDIPYLQIPKEEEQAKKEDYHIETDEEIDTSLKVNFQEMLVEDDGQMSLNVPGGNMIEKQITGQMCIEDILAEWEKTKRAAETALMEAEQRKFEATKAKALQEAKELMERLAEIIPKLDSGFSPKDLLEEKYLADNRAGNPIEDGSATEMFANMNEFLQNEINQLEAENARMDRQIEDVEDARVGRYMKEEQMPEEPADGTGEPIQDEEAEAKAEEQIPDEALAGEVKELMPEEILADEVKDLMAEEDHLPEVSFVEDSDAEWEDVPEEAQAEVPNSKVVSFENHFKNGFAAQTQEDEAGTDVDVEAAIIAETARQMAKETKEKEELPVIEFPKNFGMPKSDTWEEELPKIAEPETLEASGTITKLTKEQKEIFTYFVPIQGMEKQLCQAMTGAMQHLVAGGTAGTGNMIIQGGSGSGKTVLATNMIKALQQETGRPEGKIGKIEASALNQKDVADLLNKVAGGCLIIEKAGDLSRETAVKLSVLMEHDTSGLFVILEDTKHGIQKALSRDTGFAAKFSEKINIPIFTSDELVVFAKSYANELGYSIDELGILALYNCISNIEHVDRETTLAEVKDVVDKAITHSEKGGLKKAFSIITSRRYDDNDYIILREKDFDL